MRDEQRSLAELALASVMGENIERPRAAGANGHELAVGARDSEPERGSSEAGKTRGEPVAAWQYHLLERDQRRCPRDGFASSCGT